MGKLLLLCGTMLCLSMTAVAQDATASFDASSPAAEPAGPISFHPEDRSPWQLQIGYQYEHFTLLGQAFHTNGYNTSVTRFLNEWVGVEGTAVMGFGHTVSNGTAKSVFIGGGPHAAMNLHGRFEPWVHGLVGLEHIRFDTGRSGFGFMGGGGVDYKIGPRLFWRVQGDFVGTRFNSAMQSSYSAGTGIVLNF